MCVPEMNCRHLLALFLVTVVYVVIGGFVFSTVEIQNEERTKQKLREGFISFLGNHSCVSLKEIVDLFVLVGSDGKLARIVVYNDTVKSVWDWTGASFFAMTVVTTIGYGNISPRTSLGQTLCVVYALIGIPLTLVLLKEIGEKLYSGAKKLYKFRYFTNSETQQKVFNGVILCALSFTLVIGLPGYLFACIEDWTLSESFYFCFVTLTTIGFGDYIAAAHYDPNMPPGDLGRVYRWFVFLWIIVGLSFLSLVISLVSRILASKVSVMESYTRETLEKEVYKLKEELTHVKNKYSGSSRRVSLETVEMNKPVAEGATLISYITIPNSIVDTVGSSDIQLANRFTDDPLYNKKITHPGSAVLGDSGSGVSGYFENGASYNSGSRILIDSGSSVLDATGNGELCENEAELQGTESSGKESNLCKTQNNDIPNSGKNSLSINTKL